MNTGVDSRPESMMTKLLTMLQAGGTRRVGDLARSIETTPQMVEAMLEELTRMGFLRKVSGECGGRCGDCTLAGMCQVTSGSRLWTLTERGRQANPR